MHARARACAHAQGVRVYEIRACQHLEVCVCARRQTLSLLEIFDGSKCILKGAGTDSELLDVLMDHLRMLLIHAWARAPWMCKWPTVLTTGEGDRGYAFEAVMFGGDADTTEPNCPRR